MRTWIDNGASPSDLAYFGANGLQTGANCSDVPGVKNTLMSNLQDAVGQPRAVVLYDTYSGGNYHVVGFAGVTIVGTAGNGSHQTVALQPMVLIDPTATISGASWGACEFVHWPCFAVGPDPLVSCPGEDYAMSRKENRRKKWFVDATLQTALVTRIVLYWAACVIDIAATLIFWRIGTSAANSVNPRWDGIWFDYGPVLLALLLLLPLGIVDIVRFSNRFVGPILRLRRSMQRLARGEDVQPIQFRRGDFWQGFADEFNAVLARVQGHADAEVAASLPEDQQTPVAVGQPSHRRGEGQWI